MVSSSSRAAPRIKLLCALVASCFAAEGLANPTGPAVVSGTASFNNVGKTLTVTNSPNAIINWQGFSIGAGEATRFQQQSVSSAVLNRVVGQDPSAIFGTLWSNGKVFLINPNGVLFGQGSRIDVAGLVASTLNITNQDFLAGRLNFQAGAVAGSIVNQGEITTTTGGRIYLIAPDVQNHGLISSPGGDVLLTAGKTVSLVDADVPNLKVEVQAGGEALNVGKILAEGGKVGIYAGLINQRGVVRADSVSKDATGKIVFKASDTTILDDASVTSAAGAKGGEIQVLGNKVGLVGTAKVDASGDAGGGTVLVGGDYQGKNAAIQNASRTYVGSDASISADAINSGDGGKVIVWSDDATRFYGSIAARGGAQSGNGGFVEVSGKNWLGFAGSADTLAPNGKTGTLLLDPTNVFIAASQANATAAGMSGTDSSANSFSGGKFEASGTTQDSLLTTLSLTTALISNNVVVSTANTSGTGVGNITVVDPVSFTPSPVATNLTLLAHNDITINGAISNLGFGATVIALYAGWTGASTSNPAVNNSGVGSIHVNQPISAGLFGGSTQLTAAKDISVNSSTISSGAATSLTAVKGDITVTSGTVSSATSVSLSAPVGTIAVSNSRIDGGNSGGAVSMSAAAISVQNSNASNGVHAGGSEGSGTITLNATNGITINNSTLSTDGGSGQAASISLTAGGPIDVIGGSSLVAISSANASVSLSAGGTITVGGGTSPTIQAQGTPNATVDLLSTGGNVAIGGDILSNPGSGSGSINITASAGAITSTGGLLKIDETGTPSSAQVNLTALNGIGTLANPIRTQSSDLSAMNTGTTTGDIAVSIANRPVVIDSGIAFVKNNNPTGTYFAQAESDNLELQVPFTPGGSALLAGQSVFLKSLVGSVTIDPGANIVATGTGSVTLYGGNTAAAGLYAGVDINAAQITTQAGTISITGFGKIGKSSADPAFSVGGVTLRNGALVHTNSGALNIAGQGGSFLSGVDGTDEGILIGGAATEISTVNGAITLSGQGGSVTNPPGTSGTPGGRGIRQSNGIIQATGTGTIDMIGSGGTLTGAPNGAVIGGVLLSGSVTSVDGNINITGTGGSTTGQLSATAGTRGVSMSGTVASTGNGSITITGTGGTSNTADGNVGIFPGPLIRTHNGSILLQGTGGSSSAAGALTPGIKIQLGSTIQSTGTGSITINGTAGTAPSTPQDGIWITVNGGAPVAISTAGGGLSLAATGGGLTIGSPADGAQSVAISSGSGPLTLSSTGNVTFNPVGGSIAVSGGAVSVSAGGNFSLGAGAAIAGTDVSLLANDMDLLGTVTATNSATLAASNTIQNIDLGSLGLGGGPLSISANEITKVTAPTITIGRSDSTSNILYLNEALTGSNVHATNLKLRAFDIYENGSGGINGPFNVDLIAGRNITLAVNSIVLGDNRNLNILADSANQNGTLNIGGVNLMVGSAANTTGSMTLTGHDINATVSGGGSGAIRVFGAGNQTITATGNAIFQNSNPSTGTLLVRDDGGTQAISAGGLQLIAGPGSATTALITAGGIQNITVGSGGLNMMGGGGTAANSNVLISAFGASGTQTILVNGGGDITLNGGSGSGNSNFARINAAGTSQAITFNSGGHLVLNGGTVGNLNFADVAASNPTTGAQMQTIAGATGITLTGGASGGGVDPSNNVLGNFARIRNDNGSQTISVGSGGITMTGGGGSLTDNFAFVVQGSSTAGSPGTSQSVTINNGGAINLQGGSSAQTNVINNATNGFRGSYAQIQGNGDSQQITFASGGVINLTGGTVGSNNPAQIFSRFGLQTINGGPSITLQGGANGGYVDLALNKNEGNFARINGNAGQSITASSITLAGGGAGVGNHAQIFDNGTTTTQSISATNISLTGGAGGGIDSGSTANAMGNFALIQGSARQTITATGMSLHGGAGGQENFAAIIAPIQTITVHGDLALVGGASASGSVRGGGARIGGSGGNAPGPTDLILIVDGNLTMTGGSVANAGSAIGSGLVGGQTTTMEIDVGGSATLNPGTAANAESRIGSPASGLAGGDISITAGSTLALNSTGPGLGTAIRTLGNLALNAASITQGADSVIIAGGTTTITGGTVSLPSGTNQFGTVLLGTTGNVTITDADAINLGTSTTGSGGLTVTAPGGITQSGPITAGAASFNAGSNAITLTNSGNDFTGAVSLVGSSASIVDANALTLGSVSLGGGPLVVATGGAITQTGSITAGAASLIAAASPITLANAANDFTGTVSLSGSNVSITDANALTLGAVNASNLTASASVLTQSSSGVVVSGTSTLAAGSIALNSAANDFGTVAVSSPGNVSLTDANTISIGTASVGGTFNVVAASTSFLNGFSANNYSFSGGAYTLAAGNYNLSGTTTVAQNSVTGALTVVDVQSGATINTSGGTVTVGAGGTLKGTGTIQGNVNNTAGTVAPGASPGMLTITGNYTQGASGVLDMQIGGLVAGTDYDQLRVGGSTSLAGTLNTSLVNGFIPVPGNTFTLIQGTGPITGTFTTVNQPLGALFNTLYGLTTFDVIAASSGSVPAPIAPTFQNVIVSTDQVLTSLIQTTTTTTTSETGLKFVPGGNIDVAPATTGTTTTTAEGKIVPKPPACN